jgi:hypothetical protein
METMEIKIEDVFCPARQTTPAGSVPAKKDNDTGRKTGQFLSLGSSQISISSEKIERISCMNAEWRKIIAVVLSGSVVASIFRMVERNSTDILDYLSGILLAVLPIGMLYALFYVFTGKGKDVMNIKKYLLVLFGIVAFGFIYFVV